MQKFIAIGNLTRDPEFSETPNGTAVCKFGLAVSRRNREETDFFNCTAWRGLAETVSTYCAKGNKVAVSGHIEIRTYEDNNGNKRTAVDIVAEDVEFLTPKANSERKPKLEEFDDDDDIPF